MSRLARNSIGLAFTAVGCTVFATLAMAQTAEQTAPEAASADDIVVTARKRAESLQDVPVSVTAVNAALIERNNITRVDQVAAVTPNVSLQPVSAVPSSLSAYIRGIGSRSIEPSQDVPIAVSIDGVYLSDIAGSAVDVFDVQQIEVLRGPQGTLQGRNSPGGAINITTRRPTGEYGMRFQVNYERFDLVQVKAAVEAPIVEGKLAAKISTFYNDGGGFVKNLTTGLTTGKQHSWGGRVGLLLTPTDDFTAYLTADYVRDQSQIPGLRYVGVANAEGPRQPSPITCTVYGYCTPIPKYTTISDFADSLSSKNGGVALNMNWDLGAVALTSVSGFRFTNEVTTNDVDAIPVTELHSPAREIHTRNFSQELRLASNSNGSLDYVAGLYFARSKFDLTDPFLLGSQFLGIPGPNFEIAATSRRRQVTKSYAVFGQASYKITDAWSISGGARQTFDRKTMVSQPSVPGPDGTFKYKSNNLSIEAGTEYKLAQDIMAYFRFSQGYRSGGVNGNASSLAAINTYAPEKLNSFEGGIKTQFFDRMVTANLSAFHYDYTDIQIVAVDSTPTGTVQRIVNGKGLKIDGVEFEASIRPAQGLSINGSVGYLDAKYDSQIVDIGFGPNDLADISKDYTPKFTGYLGFDYIIPLGADEASSLTISGDVNYRSSQYTNPVANPVSFQDKYALVNASLTYKAPDDRFTITVFGRNLTDKYYITTGEAAGGYTAWEAQGRPRTYGVRFGASF